MKKEKPTELVKKWDIENTPFTIIQDNKTKMYFATIGNYKITELKPSKEALEAEIRRISWDRITQLIMILIETRLESNIRQPKTKQTWKQHLEGTDQAPETNKMYT